MRAGAQARADGFARELDREVTRVFLRLPLDQEALDRRDFTRFAQRYDAWRASAERPDLVAQVFLVEWPEDGPRASRYVPERRTFEAAEWPGRLGAVRERVGLLARSGVDERSLRSGPIAFASDGTPVLTVPVLPAPPSTWRTVRNAARALPAEGRPGGRARCVGDPERSPAGPGRAPLRRPGRPRVPPVDRARGRARGFRLDLDRCRGAPGRRTTPRRACSSCGRRRRATTTCATCSARAWWCGGEAGVAAAGRGPRTWTFTRRSDAGGERHVSLRAQRPGLWRLSAHAPRGLARRGRRLRPPPEPDGELRHPAAAGRERQLPGDVRAARGRARPPADRVRRRRHARAAHAARGDPLGRREPGGRPRRPPRRTSATTARWCATRAAA